MASTYPNPASIKTPPVGTSSVQIAPQNLSRSGLYVFNLSGSVIWVCPAQSTDQLPLAAVAGGIGSTSILPSNGLVFQEFTGAMNAIAVTGSGNQVTVWEFYHGGPTSVISAGGANSGGGGGGGVPEAPLDGLLYGRQNANWNQVPFGVSEAPLDGNIYGRDNAAWVQLTPAVNAAPFDAMAYNGMQVNGNGEVSQENGIATDLRRPGRHHRRQIRRGFLAGGFVRRARHHVGRGSRSRPDAPTRLQGQRDGFGRRRQSDTDSERFPGDYEFHRGLSVLAHGMGHRERAVDFHRVLDQLGFHRTIFPLAAFRQRHPFVCVWLQRECRQYLGMEDFHHTGRHGYQRELAHNQRSRPQRLHQLLMRHRSAGHAGGVVQPGPSRA